LGKLNKNFHIKTKKIIAMKWNSKKINGFDNQQICIRFAIFPVCMTNGDLIWWEKYEETRKYHFSEIWGFKWFVISRKEI
jgi:hypothetical protein